jgi:hypothetical protein
MIARIHAATALAATKGPLRASRELIRLQDSGSRAAVDAFQSVAADLGKSHVTPSQIAALSMLAQRAHTVGDDNSERARAAYDGSVRSLLAQTTHRATRWIAKVVQAIRFPIDQR